MSRLLIVIPVIEGAKPVVAPVPSAQGGFFFAPDQPPVEPADPDEQRNKANTPEQQIDRQKFDGQANAVSVVEQQVGQSQRAEGREQGDRIPQESWNPFPRGKILSTKVLMVFFSSRLSGGLLGT